MAFTSYDTPAEFFGADYTLTSSEIKLKTASHAGTTVGTTFQGEADDNVLTTATAHGLIIGDCVQVAANAGALPSGLAASTNYYVLTVPSTVTLTLGATRAATTPVVLGTDGAADNVIKRMGLLEEVTDAEAHATTGDVRKVIYGLLELLYARYNVVPSADRPGKLVASRALYEDSTTGEIVKTYQFTVRTISSGFDVAPE